MDLGNDPVSGASGEASGVGFGRLCQTMIVLELRDQKLTFRLAGDAPYARRSLSLEQVEPVPQGLATGQRFEVMLQSQIDRSEGSSLPQQIERLVIVRPSSDPQTQSLADLNLPDICSVFASVLGPRFTEYLGRGVARPNDDRLKRESPGGAA